jgi:hypothetical protein
VSRKCQLFAAGFVEITMPRLTSFVAIPANINAGLEGTSNAIMLKSLGSPRRSFGRDCLPVTLPALKKRILSRNIGPFSITGLDLAVASLQAVMTDIQREKPSVYKVLGSAGMLCARLVRGSSSSISNHSWGTAIDLTLGRVLDPRGDGKVQYGLTLIAPIFNRHGWYWGAGFPVEDGMHFEVSRQLLASWDT